ncbi:MAG: hypothetical protein ACRDT2_21330 [Natronosporangium sp.]
MSNLPPLGETRAFRLGQVSTYDYLLQRLAELAADLRAERASLTLPRRKPEGNQR